MSTCPPLDCSDDGMVIGQLIDPSACPGGPGDGTLIERTVFEGPDGPDACTEHQVLVTGEVGDTCGNVEVVIASTDGARSAVRDQAVDEALSASGLDPALAAQLSITPQEGPLQSDTCTALVIEISPDTAIITSLEILTRLLFVARSPSPTSLGPARCETASSRSRCDRDRKRARFGKGDLFLAAR